MTKTRITNTQIWLREYSSKLASSFRASGPIQHNLTKGESRESQILDTLSLLLPRKLSVSRNVVICDSNDVQSPQFDGVLIDYDLWPRLFCDNSTTSAMIESVCAAIEVKSSLDKGDLDDIFSKSRSLRQMSSSGDLPYVTAFSYECTNPNLCFFDFSMYFSSSPVLSPSLVCILNRNLFCLAKFDAGKAFPVDEPNSRAVPVLFSPGEDTLLVYLYFISRWIIKNAEGADFFKRYSDNVFQDMECFHFDADFLEAIEADNTKLLKARECFKGKANCDINSLYTEARRQLGLSDLTEQ